MAWTKPKDPLLSSPLYRRNRALLKRCAYRAVCAAKLSITPPLASLLPATLWRGGRRNGSAGPNR